MKISVIIAAYNAEPFIATAIESCLTQIPEPHEVIVVDDASSDRTVEIAKSYAAPVRVLSLAQNKGCSNARNVAVEAATGDWIAMLDADDWFLPGKIAALICCRAQNPEAKFIYSAFRVQKGSESWDVPAFPVKRLNSMLRYCSPLATASIIFRRDAFLALGGFDTTFRHAEDWDFFLRFAARFSTGAFACVPEVLCVYRVHRASKSHDTMPTYEARKRIMNGISLHGLSGFPRYLWRRKLNSFLHYDFSSMLRDNHSPRDLEFIARSLFLWPFPSEAIPVFRYLVAAVMMKQHIEKRLAQIM